MHPFSLGPLVVTWPLTLILAGVMGIFALPRSRSGRFVRLPFTLALICFVFAAGQPLWQIAAPGQIAVMVDLSPSTRGASFRQSAALNRRLDQLLAGKPFRLIEFANRNIAATDFVPTEIPSDQTVFTPPPVDEIVLFSDGRFALPADSPPVYPVIDPLLQDPTDASITGMELIGNRIAITVANNGRARTLTLEGVSGPQTQIVEGNQTIIRTVARGASQIVARISPGDLWPENDSMSIRILPPAASERWWAGPASPPGWQAILPSNLSSDATDYLAPSVIVLNNVAADQMSASAQARLDQYVGDLGGSLVILGGDHAFWSGGYEGSTIGELSPLASSPPAPAMRWILLIDASGSMSQSADDTGDSRWAMASRALVNLLPDLPPSDLLSVGQFSDALSWWSDGKTARQTALLDLPPPTAQPHGPTNLQPVLESIASGVHSMPTQLILLTDADVAIDQPSALAARLKQAGVHFHLLAIGQGTGFSALESIARQTGGSVMTQSNPHQWAMTFRRLLSAALPQRLRRDSTTVRFVGNAAAIPGGDVSPWNVTWPRDETTALAIGNGSAILAASWHVGLGQVLATAFSPTDFQTQSLAQLVASRPRDPRIQVSWRTGPMPRLIIDAKDRGRYLNGWHLSLQLWTSTSARPWTYAVPQTGPGTYELSLPFQSEPALATVLHDQRIIDRTTLVGWYPPEFSAIGNDMAALEELARRSGGQVILPTQTTPIQFNWPRREYLLAPWAAVAAGICLGAGLVAWRVGR